MKRTLLFILVFLPMLASADATNDSEYIPFVESGKIWHVVNSTTGYPNYHFNQYTLMNEEVVKDGKTYLKMYRTEDDKHVVYDTGLYREEDRRVYKYDEKAGRDVMLYDFSLKEGDTFTYEFGYSQPKNFKVLKQGWLDNGPKIVKSRTLTPTGTKEYNYRQLRTWTIGREREDTHGEYYEVTTWVEGVGTLENLLARLEIDGKMDCMAYVERDENKCDYSENTYLPFSFYDYWGPVYGCNLPKGAADYSESDGHHQLTYEQEGDRLHVHGKVFTQCGPNSYAYFIAEPLNDLSGFKLRFEIQEVEPLADCMGLFYTDFYISGLEPLFDYKVVVDNQGEEHPVIKKTQQDMPYRPFVEDGKVWIVRGKGISSDGDPMEPWIDYCYLDGDTIIGGQTCKRMMCIKNDNHSPLYIGAWYEQDKKVYFAVNDILRPDMYMYYSGGDNRPQFELLYDFTLSSGDNIQTPLNDLWTVNKKSSGITGFKGTYYDFIYNDKVVEHWFEGVGSDSWPFQSHPLWLDGDTGGVLLACIVGDDVIYYNSEENDPYILGARKRRFDFTHTIKTQPKARNRSGAEQPVYGEYNDLQLGINLDPLDDAYQVRITDESGKVVYEKSVNAGTIVGLNIDISSYAKGRYTVTVENSTESFTGEFEVQTTGIRDVRCKKEEIRNAIYNLQGQRLSTLQKGLNIVNGQKVYVK